MTGMKTIRFFGLICLAWMFVLGCGNDGGRPSSNATYPKSKGVTRLVQYNVGAFSKEIDNSIPMVAAMMKEIGADVLSLNELDSCNTRHTNNQLADLAGAMGGWNFFYSRAMAYRDGAYGVGVAVPGKILDSFTIALPKGEGSEPRACSVVETKEYVFASTHLDYKDVPSMVIQARTINEAIKARYGGSKKPVFLAGDMNSLPGSEVLRELEKEWKVLSANKFSYSSDKPYECIDFILALNNGARYKAVGTDVMTLFASGDVAIASDHLPVFVDVKL